LSQEDKENFLGQTKINILIEEKSQYEDLLCKHYNEFSKDKSDLGKRKSFEHKIDSKEDSPVYVSVQFLTI
jgi:hypothetical protein